MVIRRSSGLGGASINLDRSTLADWVGRPSWHQRPVHERLLEKLKASPELFADEATVPVLDPGCGRSKTGQLGAYARDDRPWKDDDGAQALLRTARHWGSQ